MISGRAMGAVSFTCDEDWACPYPGKGGMPSGKAAILCRGWNTEVPLFKIAPFAGLAHDFKRTGAISRPELSASVWRDLTFRQAIEWTDNVKERRR